MKSRILSFAALALLITLITGYVVLTSFGRSYGASDHARKFISSGGSSILLKVQYHQGGIGGPRTDCVISRQGYSDFRIQHSEVSWKTSNFGIGCEFPCFRESGASDLILQQTRNLLAGLELTRQDWRYEEAGPLTLAALMNDSWRMEHFALDDPRLESFWASTIPNACQISR